MKRKKKGIFREAFGLLWKRIFAGMLLVVPFYVTYHVIRLIFLYIDGLSQPMIRPLVGHRVRGVGFILTFLFLYVLGLIATNVFGRSLLKSFENILLRTPVVKNVYAAAKQVIETVSLPSKENFKRVILVEYPRKGVFAIGFVTGSTKGPDEKTLLSVFMPSPPNPATGNLIFVPETEAVDTHLSIEEAVKIVVSGGFLTPKEIEKG